MAKPIRQPNTKHAANVLHGLSKSAACHGFFIDYISKEMGMNDTEKAKWLNERLEHDRARWFGEKKP